MYLIEIKDNGQNRRIAWQTNEIVSELSGNAIKVSNPQIWNFAERRWETINETFIMPLANILSIKIDKYESSSLRNKSVKEFLD